jgi:hypothetical protein
LSETLKPHVAVNFNRECGGSHVCYYIRHDVQEKIFLVCVKYTIPFFMVTEGGGRALNQGIISETYSVRVCAGAAQGKGDRQP